MCDLVIRGGNVVDGSGAPARAADVAVLDGLAGTETVIDDEFTGELPGRLVRGTQRTTNS